MFKVALHNTDKYTATRWHLPYNIIEQASKCAIIFIQLVCLLYFRISPMPLFINTGMEILDGTSDWSEFFKCDFLKCLERADFVQCCSND